MTKLSEGKLNINGIFEWVIENVSPAFTRRKVYTIQNVNTKIRINV